MRKPNPSLFGVLLVGALLAGACSGEDEATPEPAAVVTSEPEPTPEETPTPTETETEEEVEFTAEQQEVADVFPLAFDTDPAVAGPAYAPDAELEGILVAAGEAAEARGDTTIGVAVTSVDIDGDQAQVGFNILLNGAVVAPSSGVAVKVDGEWKVHVSTLCNLLSIAGPAPEGCERVTPPA